MEAICTYPLILLLLLLLLLLFIYLFTAIGLARGGSGPYTTQLQQNA
jgi:hypothetical protein